MRLFALLQTTRSERRAYAAALGELARRGHDVTVAVPPYGRAFTADVHPARLSVLEPVPEDEHVASDAPPLPAVARDLPMRLRLSRAAYEHARAASADALFLDVASGLAVIPALWRGPRKVALRLDSWEELAQVREPNIAEEDHARFIANACSVELSERECGAAVTPRTLPPAVADAWLERPLAAEAAPRERPVVAAVLPWIPAFGFDVVVQAFRRIRRARPDAVLITAGEGACVFDARREFRDVVLDRIAGEDRGAITFLDDAEESLRDLLSTASVLLHPSFVPASGVQLVEALAAGVPIVASGLEAFRAGLGLADGESALFAPPGDPAAFADAALRLLSDRDRARGIAARGRELARERFTLGRLAADLEGLYAAADGGA